MTNKRIKRFHLITIILFFLVGSAFLIYFAIPLRLHTSPTIVENGVSDLTATGRSNVVYLKGTWEGVVGRTVLPHEFPGSEAVELKVPGSIAGRGTVTYRVTLSGLDPRRDYAAFLLETAAAARVYADGRLIGTTGSISAGGEVDPDFVPRVLSGVPRGSDIALVIQVFNGTHSSTGLRQGVYFGPREEIRRFRDHLSVADALLIGALLAIALYHMILATVFPADGATLGFALFALLVAIKAALSGQQIWLYHTGAGDQLTWIRLAYVAVTLALPTLLWYTRRVFGGRLGRRNSLLVLQAVFIAALVQSVLAFLLPFWVLQRWYAIWHVVTLVMFLYVGGTTIAAVRTREVGAVVSLVGALFVCGIAINDILFDLHVIRTTYLLPIGVFGFVLSQATMIALRFYDLFRRTNALRNGLEETIVARTRELQEERNRMQKLARHDELTQLVNRRYGAEILVSEVERVRRYQQPLATVLIDLDNFKLVNDTRGHQVGDEILRGFSRILQQTTRSTDTACRWGGEEFLLILPNTEVDEALALTKKLQETLHMMPIETRAGLITLTFSSGISGVPRTKSYSPNRISTGEHIDDLLKASDIGLYEAKRAGRDRIRVVEIDSKEKAESDD